MRGVAPHFSPFRAAGRIVFVSGQLPFGPDGEIIQGGIREQTLQCLANVSRVLTQSGFALEDVVKTTVWLSRVSDFVEFNSVYAEAFPGNPPARSTVRADLMRNALVEIEAIAARDP